MALLTQDMSVVPAPGDLVEEGLYEGRISKVEEKDSDQGKPMIIFTVKIQSEGPSFGRTIPIFASLQANALFTLKGVYKAIGYNPGPEGHDPDKALDAEIKFKVVHQLYKGNTVASIPPYSIKSLVDFS